MPNSLRSVQPHLSERMRAVLVDWLVEVQESFELNHETLYTAVKMIDIYLSRVRGGLTYPSNPRYRSITKV